MNTRQALKQMRATLLAATWPNTGGRLFPTNSVAVSAGTTLEFVRTLRMPASLIRPGSAQADPEWGENPSIWIQEVALQLFQVHVGDATGELCLLGTGNPTERGYGLLELEERVLSEVGLLNELEGLDVVLRTRSAIGAEISEDRAYLCHRTFLFELACQAEAFYQAAAQFTASVAGGTVSLAWSLPSSRYDIVGAVLRRASGSSAPSSVAAGTGVTLASQLDESVDDTPGSGTWSYALFVEYSDGSTSYSSAVVQEGVVVP